MKTLDKLLDLIENDPAIVRFKELEQIIDHDDELQREYGALLNLQKVMVQRQATKHPNAEAAEQEYETAKTKLLEHVLMSEYLDLLEDINENLNMIQSILESEIANDFE